MASQQTRSTNDTLGKVGTFVVGFLIFLGYKYYTSSPKVPVPAQAPQMSKEQLLMLQLQAQQQQIQQLQQQQQYNQLQNAYNNAEQQARFDSMQRQHDGVLAYLVQTNCLQLWNRRRSKMNFES